MLLSSCLGATVRRGGRRIGHVADLGVAPGGPAPAVTGVLVHRRDSAPVWAPWGGVLRLDGDGAILAPAAALEVPPTMVLLVRDVLDAQLIDLAGRRVVRVGDVRLRPDEHALLVEGVEAGLDSVLRRLGLQRLARHAPRNAIAWSDLHLPTHPGAALSLERAAPALERLDTAERERLAARLPARVATTLLRVPRHRIAHRFPTHVLRRRRAPR